MLKSVRGNDEMDKSRRGEPVDESYGVAIRTLLERQPLNPFKRMEFSVLSFRHCEAMPVLPIEKVVV
jgi:hypothetical protein